MCVNAADSTTSSRQIRRAADEAGGGPASRQENPHELWAWPQYGRYLVRVWQNQSGQNIVGQGSKSVRSVADRYSGWWYGVFELAGLACEQWPVEGQVSGHATFPDDKVRCLAAKKGSELYYVSAYATTCSSYAHGCDDAEYKKEFRS